MKNSSYVEPLNEMKLFNKPAFHLSILLLIFIMAFAVRLYNVTSPPHDFATERFYQAAHIARADYFETLDSIPEWRKNIAEINKKRMGLLLEPRIMEYLTVSVWRILGQSPLWVPRVISSIFWMTGGVFLFLIARKLSSIEAALFSTAFYLFLPFGILASRSFQPDPLMVMLLIGSIFMIMRFYEQPTSGNMVWAALLSALAMLAKPYSLFFIYGAFFSLSIYRNGVRKTLFNLHTLLFTVLSFLPTCLYYVYGMLTNVGYLGELAQGSLLPHLILKSYFWRDWFLLIGLVVGYVAFAGSIAGIFMNENNKSRALLLGLWCGYLIFGLFFTLHIHTHDYYHLPLIPVVALSLGSVGALIVHFLYKRWRSTLITVCALAIVAGIIVTQNDMAGFVLKNKNELKILTSLIGINPQFKKFANHFEREVKMAEEIGEIVEHSTNTVFLTPHFGRMIAYIGELSGLPWPTSFSLMERRERGLDDIEKRELYNQKYLTIRTHGRYIKYTPDYFIITEFREFEEQAELREFLRTNFPVIAQSEDYIIFDLRKMSG